VRIEDAIPCHGHFRFAALMHMQILANRDHNTKLIPDSDLPWYSLTVVFATATRLNLQNAVRLAPRSPRSGNVIPEKSNQIITANEDQ